MERLTVRTVKGAALRMDDTYPDEASAVADLMQKYRLAVDRLAAYEDTGLEPEEITKRLIAHQTNAPLTLEELREMDGEPVWVEPINSKYRKARWGIVHLCPPPKIAEPRVIRVLDGADGFDQAIPYPKKKRDQLYGKSWLAYRRKPEGGN